MLLISIGVWWFLGLLGSLMIGLGTSTDGEGIDATDKFILFWFSVAGPCTFILGIPFFSFWIQDKFK